MKYSREEIINAMDIITSIINSEEARHVVSELNNYLKENEKSDSDVQDSLENMNYFNEKDDTSEIIETNDVSLDEDNHKKECSNNSKYNKHLDVCTIPKDVISIVRPLPGLLGAICNSSWEGNEPMDIGMKEEILKQIDYVSLKLENCKSSCSSEASEVLVSMMKALLCDLKKCKCTDDIRKHTIAYERKVYKIFGKLGDYESKVKAKAKAKSSN